MMRAVVQRVSRAKVSVGEEVTGEIGKGLLVLLAIGQSDAEADADYCAEKICGLRVFEDDEDKMNRSVLDVGGSVLAVSQFTLYGDVRRGKRPSFDAAARPEAGKKTLRIFRRTDSSRGSVLRDRTLPGDDEGGTRERRSGNDTYRFSQDFLGLGTGLLALTLGFLRRAHEKPKRANPPFQLLNNRRFDFYSPPSIPDTFANLLRRDLRAV